MSATRLTFVDVIPVPYRAPLYARLAQDPAYDLRVFFCGRTHVDRSWGSLELDFPHAFLHGTSVTSRRGNVLTYHFEPDVLRAVAAPRPDVLVLGGWAQPTFLLAGLAAKVLRVPYLVNSESHASHPRSARARALRSAVFAPFVRGAAGGLATGSLARDYLVELGLPRSSTFILPNACDVDAVEAAADAARASGEATRLRAPFGNAPVVAYVGRLVRVKGVDSLLDALALLAAEGREVACLVAGDGPDRSALERRAAELGLDRVRFLGALTADRVAAVYAAADLVCVPSRDEPWGVVVNEAMSAGVPVVASTAVGAAADLVVPGETGERFSPGDAAGLAQAVRATLDDDPAARGTRARALVGEWGFELAERQLQYAIAYVRGRS